MKEFIFHNTHTDGRRYTVVGYSDSEQPNSVRFAVSLCAKEDRFEKKIGRAIASKRVLLENKYVRFIFNTSEAADRSEFNKEVKTLLYNLDWVSVYFKKYPHLNKKEVK